MTEKNIHVCRRVWSHAIALRINPGMPLIYNGQERGRDAWRLFRILHIQKNQVSSPEFSFIYSLHRKEKGHVL